MENKTKTTKIKNSSAATVDFPAIRACDNKILCKSLNFTHKRAFNKEKDTLKINGGNTQKDKCKKKDLNKAGKINEPKKNINQNKSKAKTKTSDQILKITKNKTNGKVKTNEPIASEEIFKHPAKRIINKTSKREFFKTLKVQHLTKWIIKKFASLKTKVKN